MRLLWTLFTAIFSHFLNGPLRYSGVDLEADDYKTYQLRAKIQLTKNEEPFNIQVTEIEKEIQNLFCEDEMRIDISHNCTLVKTGD